MLPAGMSYRPYIALIFSREAGVILVRVPYWWKREESELVSLILKQCESQDASLGSSLICRHLLDGTKSLQKVANE